MEGKYKYIDIAVADNQQGAVLQLGSWARGYELLTIKKELVTKCRASDTDRVFG
jgi:hypothetical protein